MSSNFEEDENLDSELEADDDGVSEQGDLSDSDDDSDDDSIMSSNSSDIDDMNFTINENDNRESVAKVRQKMYDAPMLSDPPDSRPENPRNSTLPIANMDPADMAKAISTAMKMDSE